MPTVKLPKDKENVNVSLFNKMIKQDKGQQTLQCPEGKNAL